MKILNNCVLLLKAEKSEDTEDKYEVALKEQGFEVRYIRTLEFQFSNLKELHTKVSNADDYAGIIFTTPRSVRALKEALNSDATISMWKHKLNYVVGETTHELVLKEFDLNCKGRESGNAKNLSEIILKDENQITKPLLFPCGNLKTETLTENLSNVVIEPVTVYETVASSTLEDDFSRVTSNYEEIPKIFVYFSPSGVNFTRSCLARLQTVRDDVKFVAIGPSTESALKRISVVVASIAKKPTPQDLMHAVLNCK